MTTYVNRGVAPKYVDGPSDVWAFNQKCVRPDRSVVAELGRPIDPTLASTFRDAVLRDGDVVVNSTGVGTLGRAGYIDLSSADVEATLVADGHVTILRARTDLVVPRYLWYLFATDAFYEIANVSLSVGSTNQTELGREAIRSLGISLPAHDEQQKLVEVLDVEIARIDSLLLEQQTVVELLWERRRAAVFHAVTGRDVEGERKPGPPWTGSIPSAWGAPRVLNVARLGTGHTPARNRPELWEDCTIPWITTGEVSQIRSDEQEVLSHTREMISERGVAESAAVVHPSGTVVLCRTAASAGFSAIMSTDMATSQDFATWTCGPDLLPDFLLYCLRAMRTDLLERLAIGSTHHTIYMPEIRTIAVPLPPVETQRTIVDGLRETITRLDNARHEAERQVGLLREHRQALINAAVSGGLVALGKVA